MALAAPTLSSPYHVLLIEGKPKTAKTHRALKAPGICSIHSTDNGWDGLIQKLYPDTWKSRFLVGENRPGAGGYFSSIDLSADELWDAGDREASAVAADRQAEKIGHEVWKPFLADVQAAFKHPGVRSVVIDLANEMNKFLQLKHFGKITKNSQQGYGLVNAEWAQVLRLAHEYRKNLVLVYSLRAVFAEKLNESGRSTRVATGEYERSGNESLDYLVTSFIRTDYIPPKRDAGGAVVEDGKFLFRIKLARHNPDANGMVLEGDLSWADLMMFLHPQIAGEEWGE